MIRKLLGQGCWVEAIAKVIFEGCSLSASGCTGTFYCGIYIYNWCRLYAELRWMSYEFHVMCCGTHLLENGLCILKVYCTKEMSISLWAGNLGPSCTDGVPCWHEFPVNTN